MSSSALNPLLLAANIPLDPRLLPLLHSNPSLASQQDSNGYSLLHAAASYDHITLIPTLLSPPFSVSINLTDSDDESALFYAETVEMAQLLLSHGIDATLVNSDEQTALQKLESEEEYPDIIELLRTHASGGQANGTTTQNGTLPRLPPNIQMNINTTAETEETETQEPDPEFRRRIEELAARENFQSEEGQRELRALITDAVRDVGDDNERDVRRRVT